MRQPNAKLSYDGDRQRLRRKRKRAAKAERKTEMAPATSSGKGVPPTPLEKGPAVPVCCLAQEQLRCPPAGVIWAPLPKDRDVNTVHPKANWGRYLREGYSILPHYLPPEAVKELREAVEDLIEKKHAIPISGKIHQYSIFKKGRKTGQRPMRFLVFRC
jgi:hypothetical protein